jgi:hypothetical protein
MAVNDEFLAKSKTPTGKKNNCKSIFHITQVTNPISAPAPQFQRSFFPRAHPG